MSEEILEKVAQVQHQNTKLLDELNHLKEHTFSLEENLNLKYLELSEEKKRLKSVEQQCKILDQMIKEKDNLIDSLENEKNYFSQMFKELSSENLSLKEELLQEKSKNKLIEVLKAKEGDLKNMYSKVKEENNKLIAELSLKTNECFSNAATIKDLQFQIKELENEKSELMALRDALLAQEKDERLRSSETLECFLRKSPEWSKSQINICFQDEQDLTSTSFSRETTSINLREEILEVELQEKQEKISQLESLLRRKERDEVEKSMVLAKFKEELRNTGLLNYDSVIDLKLDFFTFRNIYNRFLKVINWPEGQSAECKPLADVGALTVVIKDGIQTTQPSSVRVIETISIASQTDPIKNLSSVLPLKTFEKSLASLDPSLSRSNSDDEEEPLSFIEKNGVTKGFQLFTEPKNCDLDMDMYRSCRKLSVLPEEDVEESHNRKSSLKKNCTSRFSIHNLKTQSANDITKIQIIKPTVRANSCINITLENYKSVATSESLQRKSSFSTLNGGTKESGVIQNLTYHNNKADDELQLSFISAKEAFRQPHSFESYLDPVIMPNTLLPRQTSDPTQNTVFAPPITRRGSYIRRPKSTCRPLTLPCDKINRKKEERICKVRFDLPVIAPKSDENMSVKQFNSSSLNNSKKIKMVSRFRVEIIDEIEFRKSLQENLNKGGSRKRPPLIHSVVYKKSALRDLTNLNENIELILNNGEDLCNIHMESPGSPVYDTATENSPAGSFDIEENECFSDVYPSKRRRQSDISCCSLEDSQDSSTENDILIKSIKLHTNSDCIIMKDLKKESSDSSSSNADSEIPFIDAEDLPVVKPSPNIIKSSPGTEIYYSEKQLPFIPAISPGSASEESDAYLTPCDNTPVSENNEASGSSKTYGLSKSPTVLKNLANFELLASMRESVKLLQSDIIEEETRKEDQYEEKLDEENENNNISNEIILPTDSLNKASSDVSEASESDTLTYCTVKSHVAFSSDGDSDTYVTIWSDKSFSLERKFSDLSENSSSPYNTPPDTSSASFCTPPDTYSPILNSAKKNHSVMTDKSYPNFENDCAEKRQEEYSNCFCSMFDTPTSSPPPHHTNNFLQNNGFFNNQNKDNESSKSAEGEMSENHNVIFDLPKLEFYETNDSMENLEIFLQTEEGLRDYESQETYLKTEKPNEMEGLCDLTIFETEELKEILSKQSSLESPKILERRNKKHPPLSRQNSTEEYNFLDPHDSCLNLSEEISSPSTTPDTSNKTVIFKNVPLTVSNTIDLDDDFPISESEMQININGSQRKILEISRKDKSFTQHCLSEPCTPSISSADFLEFSVSLKPRSSFTEEFLMRSMYETSLPEIVVSRMSSESEYSDSDIPDAIETDFASNVSDRSEVHLSDVISISGHSDNSNSFSEHSNNLNSDVCSSDSDKSRCISPEVSQNSSSPASDKTPPSENSVQEEGLQNVLCDDFQ